MSTGSERQPTSSWHSALLMAHGPLASINTSPEAGEPNQQHGDTQKVRVPHVCCRCTSVSLVVVNTLSSQATAETPSTSGFVTKRSTSGGGERAAGSESGPAAAGGNTVRGHRGRSTGRVVYPISTALFFTTCSPTQPSSARRAISCMPVLELPAATSGRGGTCRTWPRPECPCRCRTHQRGGRRRHRLPSGRPLAAFPGAPFWALHGRSTATTMPAPAVIAGRHFW